MASDRPGETRCTPPRPPAPPRLVSGASPGSSRGKLRSEYQARLGGMSVKKRRAGPLKFPGQSGGAKATGTAGASQLSATARTPPPPPPGVRQTSLLDFCTVTSDRSAAVASGLPRPGDHSQASAVVVTPQYYSAGTVPREGGVEGAQAAAMAAGLVAARVSQESGRGDGDKDLYKEAVDVQAVVSPSPVPSRARLFVDNMDTADMDVEEVDHTKEEQNEEEEEERRRRRQATAIPGYSTPTPPPHTDTTRRASPGAFSPATPVRRSTPPDSRGLLGSGAATALGGHFGGSGGKGAGCSGAGGARMVDSRTVYSDRFIPSRFGSVLESGSPFLAGSSASSLPSPRAAADASVGLRNSQSIDGTNGRSLASFGGRAGSAAAAAARREAIDPGGIRGTEGAPAPGQGMAAGVAGGTGAGVDGAATPGGDAASVVGVPQYWPYGSSVTDAQREGQTMLNMLLRSELLGADGVSSPGRPDGAGAAATGLLSDAAGGSGGRMGVSSGSIGAGARGGGGGGGAAAGTSPNVFRFKVPRQAYEEDVTMSYSISPISQSTKLLSKPSKAKRKIPKIPFKVLDAPNLQDDFYLNLVDWSSQNVLAVGLGTCVYLWSACTSKVTKLCDLGGDAVASVAWTQRGTHLGVGTTGGQVQIWDTFKCKKIRTMTGHSNRVGTMCWNAHSLASGSRDRLILMRDVRTPENFTHKLVGHKQEVCGLKWSFDDKQLASGGNDNKLFIWNAHSTSPILRFTEHTAAVKAIAWSPHQHGVLASGGGTADRCIRFWNSQTSARLSCVDTGSQVCNLMWSKNINEIVSTHGYSLNQIIVWRYPSMTKVTTLTGHTLRVLYLAMSPDGQTIVTGAGDETLRFWNAFPGPKSKEGSGSAGLLFPAGVDIR